MHGGAHVGTRQSEAFSKVQRGAELGDRLLPHSNLGGVGRRGQPPGERFFTGPRASERQQLEERPAAEEIQVVRIHVVIVTKPIAGLTRAYPPVFEPCQAALVEGHAPHRGGALANDAVVAPHEPREDRYRNRQPPEAETRAPTEDCQEYSGNKGGQTRVTQALVSFAQGVATRAPRLETRPILL